jgi:membrane-associated protease RseP (regulator of RpoE activity)
VTDSLLYVLGILAVAVGIGFSIGLHELGHLLPAKLFGIKVPRYAIGFGPKLFSKQIGETEYSIRLIPLGGFITMIGMYLPSKPGQKEGQGFFSGMVTSARHAHEEHVGPGDEGRMFFKLPVYKRLVIMFGGPLMNLILGTVLMSVALSGIGVQQRSLTVGDVSACVIFDPTIQQACQATDPVSPAKVAGLAAGDKIVSYASTPVGDWQSLSGLMKASETAEIVVERSGELVSLNITPAKALRGKVGPNGSLEVDADGKPILISTPVLGISLGTELRPLPLGISLTQSASSVGQVFDMIGHLPQQLTETAVATFSGEPRKTSGAISIVGIGQIAGEVSSSETASGFEKLSTGLLILASLNFALFAFNMLPLLPLDGGHIAGGVYEWIKRGVFKVLRKPDPGPVDTAILMPLTWFVFILLMAMSAVLIVADIINPISY